MRLALLAAIVIGVGAEGQEPAAREPAAIDRTDPAAVARAYVRACRSGDADTAMRLLTPGDPLTLAMAEVGDEMQREAEGGFTLARWISESACLPFGIEFAAETPVVQEEADGTARVTVRRTWDLRQQFVMEMAEDGTWSINALDSMRATTGATPSLAAAGSGQTAGSRSAYESESRLRALAKAFRAYAGDHDNALPPAASWADAIEPYVLDMQIFQCPVAPDQEYGYAMSALADGAQLPRASREGRNMALLFEWRGAERNASAPPDELAEMEPLWPDGTIILVDANANPWRLPRGMTLGQYLVEEKHQQKCNANLRALAQAARRYARDNDGMLPSKDSWQDDLALYLLQETGVVDVFRCLKAVDLDYAYAINAAVAGMDATELTGHDEIILFFESDLNVANASGDPDRDAATSLRHVDEWDPQPRNQVSYLNGLSGTHRPSPE